MTDIPTDDTGGSPPPATPSEPAAASGTAPADDGVCDRLRRRYGGASLAATLLAVALATIGGAAPQWFPRAAWWIAGGVLVVVLLALAGWLAGIARAWAAAAAQVAAAGGSDGDRTGPPGERGTVGSAVALHVVRPGLPRRRVAAGIVPVRTVAGPLADGGALLVHGRRDGRALTAGQPVTVSPVGRHGYLLADDDGTVFVASRGWLSAW